MFGARRRPGGLSSRLTNLPGFCPAVYPPSLKAGWTASLGPAPRDREAGTLDAHCWGDDAKRMPRDFPARERERVARRAPFEGVRRATRSIIVRICAARDAAFPRDSSHWSILSALV